VSHADELLAASTRPSSRSNKSQHRTDPTLTSNQEPEKQLTDSRAIENAAARNQKLHPERHSNSHRAEIARISVTHTTHIGLTLPINVEEKASDMDLPNCQRQKRNGFASTATALEQADKRALLSWKRGTVECGANPRILNETGQHAELRTMLSEAFANIQPQRDAHWLAAKKELEDLIPGLLWRSSPRSRRTA